MYKHFERSLFFVGILSFSSLTSPVLAMDNLEVFNKLLLPKNPIKKEDLNNTVKVYPMKFNYSDCSKGGKTLKIRKDVTMFDLEEEIKKLENGNKLEEISYVFLQSSINVEYLKLFENFKRLILLDVTDSPNLNVEHIKEFANRNLGVQIASAFGLFNFTKENSLKTNKKN